MFRTAFAALFATCQALAPALAADLTGRWTLTTLDGTAVAFTATLDLSDPGKLTGKAPCNSYFGKLRIKGDAFTPGPILATRMACDGLANENRYLQALQMVDTAALAGDRLTLTGDQVLTFSRAAD